MNCKCWMFSTSQFYVTKYDAMIGYTVNCARWFSVMTMASRIWLVRLSKKLSSTTNFSIFQVLKNNDVPDFFKLYAIGAFTRRSKRSCRQMCQPQQRPRCLCPSGIMFRLKRDFYRAVSKSNWFCLLPSIVLHLWPHSRIRKNPKETITQIADFLKQWHHVISYHWLQMWLEK